MTPYEMIQSYEKATEILDRCGLALDRVLSRIQNNEADGLKAQSFSGGGGGSELTVTEQAAEQRLDGRDTAKAQLQRIERIIRTIVTQADKLLTEMERALPRRATRFDERHVEDSNGERGCMSCARVNRVEAVTRRGVELTPAIPYVRKVWIRGSTVGHKLAEPLDLCRPCYDHIRDHGTEKSLPQLRESMERERSVA